MHKASAVVVANTTTRVAAVNNLNDELRSTEGNVKINPSTERSSLACKSLAPIQINLMLLMFCLMCFLSNNGAGKKPFPTIYC